MTLLRNPACRAAVLAALTAIVLPVSAMTAERRSTIDDQETVAVTIYNENLALVKDTRRLNLDAGVNHVAMREVSARIRPETAQLRSLSDPGAFHLLEQNFDFDLLTPAKLLEKFVGRKVRIARNHPVTGVEIIEQAEVLSVVDGVVLRIGNRIETGLNGRIIFDQVPDNLRDRPTLVVQLDNRRAGEQQVELSYLTGGLSWKADYVAELNDKDSALQLHGWVTLTNRSGTGYRSARLQLVAGDVNQVKEDFRRVGALRAMKMREDSAPATMAQESLFEYHLYTLNRLTTISDNQTKQVALLSAPVVPVKKEFLLSGNDYYYRSSHGDLGQKMKVGVFVHFDNRDSSGLGMPLPKGVVRVYKKDRAGNAQFIGEDRIDHTPENETVRLKLGDAFDVTASKKQTDFRRRPATSPHNYAYESAYEIVLRNAKKEAVTVTVREPVPGDWRMLASSHGHEKVASGTAQWQVTVPAGGEARLNWRVLLRF
ncbi:MAG: DUF4139 domain-containing protein [Candidatus Muproteobacteria bacterium RBG_16_62_13]|uniref:DUF4139 domain-containing protein n=1 Tax=Candidatus Muproteobacteria bacterium RBG_16_62_13 TaxID=1817756 RepID=A0A1F6SXN4_9PROT|nr:MAG: DUF4139 domain-containing protein [Candidatus Muproteobacteria bacterium RBG_16_62_13]